MDLFNSHYVYVKNEQLLKNNLPNSIRREAVQ